MLTGINWDKVLQKHDEYNPDYRRRYMDEGIEEQENNESEEKE